MLYKILNWEEFRATCYEDAYNWHNNGNTADELTAEDILNEYPDDYFTEEFQEVDELSHCFTPEEFAEQTLEYLRIITKRHI